MVSVVSDVGIWEKPALEGTALWNGLPLWVLGVSADGWPLVRPGET